MINVSIFLERETDNVTKHFRFLKNENINKKQETKMLPNGTLIIILKSVMERN